MMIKYFDTELGKEVVRESAPLTNVEVRFIRAHSNLVNCFNPSEEQQQEFEAALHAVNETENLA